MATVTTSYLCSASFSLLNWVPLDYKQLNRTPQVTGNDSIHCRPPNSLRHNSESPGCRVRGTGDATRVTLCGYKISIQRWLGQLDLKGGGGGVVMHLLSMVVALQMVASFTAIHEMATIPSR